MALSIKDAETDALVRELAERKAVSFTEAIRLAVRHELEGARRAREDGRDRKLAAIRLIQQRTAALPLLDGRGADDILGYDEAGLST